MSGRIKKEFSMTNLKSKIAKASLGVVGTIVALASFAGTAAAAGYTFTTTLAVGSTGEAVRQLQMVLNSNPATALAVAAGATGSAGHESMYFGPATKAAVMKFQAVNNLPQVGQVGPMTRALLNGAGGTQGTTTPPGGTTQTGPVTAMSTGPAAGNIIQGQSTADLLDIKFTGNGTVTAMTLQRVGISVSTDLTNVYLYNGVTRLADGASVNTNGVISFNGLSIPVNGTTTVSVLADISASATTGTIGVNLTGFTANGQATTANVMGNLMYVYSAPSGMAAVQICTGGCTATGASNNQIANTSINAGMTGQTVWQAPVQVSGRSVNVKGVTFRFVGSAGYDAIQNVKLYVDGVQMGAATTVNATGYIVFAPNMILNTGSHTVELRADVVKGSNRSFQISLQNAADFMVTDTQLGVNVAPTTNSSTSFSQSSAGTITVNSGSVTVSIDPTFQTMTNVTGGATNTTIAKYRLHGYGEDVKVTSLQVTPGMASATLSSGSCTSNTNCSLNNVSLFFNGSQIGSSTTWNGSSATTLTFNLGSSLIVPANQDSTLEVRADLQNTSNVNYTGGIVTATLEGSTSMNNGQGLQSLDSTIDVPAADVTTTGLTIQTGVITVAKNASYSNQTLNPNTSGAKIGSFVIQNQSTSESVRVTNLAVGLTLTTISSTNLSNLRTSETSGSGSTPINPSTANSFSVDFTLAPGTTKTIDIFADLGTASVGAVTTTLQLTAVGSSSNVTLCSSSVTSGSTNGCNTGTALNGQAITLGSGTFGTPTIVTSGSTIAQYVAGGTTTGATDATKAEFKFTASSGSAVITELGFEDTVGSNALTGIRVGTVSSPIASNKAYLYGLNIAVPNGGAGATVDAFASYAPVGSTGLTTTTTGDITSLLKLIYVKYTIGGTTSTLCASGKAPGAGNCTATTGMPVNSAQTMTLVGSKPIVTVSQPSNVVLTVGNVEAIDVTIAADNAGPITINTFAITSALAAGAGSPTFATGSGNAFVVKDANNNTISTTGNFTSTAGGTATITLGSGYLLNAGASQTFKVFLPVAAVGTGTLPNTYMYTSLAATSGFTWTDTAGNASAATSTNITGNIYNFPSTFTSAIHN